MNSAGSSKKFPHKKAVKFDLVPRSQKDPLIVDYEAPPIVLIPKRRSDEKHLDQIDPILKPSSNEAKKGILEKAFEKDGIALDVDVLNAMSKDFDYEDPNNVIDDDFFQQAGGLIEEDSDSDEKAEEFKAFIKFNAENDDDGDEEPVEEDLFKDNDVEMHMVASRKPRSASNFSMTSSVMRRSQGLQQIDEHFERLYEREYADDTEIGALDLNEVKGEELLQDIERIKQLKQEVKEVRKKNFGEDYVPELVSDHHKNAIIGSDSELEEEDVVEVALARRENKVDCESILSYNSTLFNHPKLILEPRKRKRISECSAERMDVDMADESGDGSNMPTNSKTMSVASSTASVLTRLSIRPDNETPLEKKERKKALKDYRKMRRVERKTNQKIFTAEKNNLVRQQNSRQPAIKLK